MNETAIPANTFIISEPRVKLYKFIFYENEECIECDYNVVITGVAAKILFKILHDFKNKKRTGITHREFKREKWIFPEYSMANFEIRFNRLTKALSEKCPFVKIEKRQRGTFSVEYKSDFLLVKNK